MTPALLPSLAWFARVARQGSFTRAADELGVTRAAVSQNLKALERQLGVRLLHRTTRDMSLTEAGQQLLDTLVPALEKIERAVQRLGDVDGAPSGLLRINTSRLAARALLAPHLAEFHQRYPAVKVELVMADSLSNIIADGCDVGIRLGHSLSEHVVAVPITPPLSMAVVASPTYLDRRGTPKTVEDLIGHDCINYRFAGSGALREWDFNEPGSAGRHFTQAVAGSFTSNDDESMVTAAVQGLGLIQIVDIAVRPQLADGSLVRVMREWTHELAAFYLYSPSREHRPAKVQALHDFLIEKRAGITPA
ncbi:LysR family transcriptional regulator [Mitsuaria sp. CC2]|jgi:DNA-binding transcriptional LysR family regulator|uniref:LysR family transcriptional regulator n=1 Tax=Mitsuaria sp. CC2 TaxID=3029186 RepID=UPI003B8D02A4